MTAEQITNNLRANGSVSCAYGTLYAIHRGCIIGYMINDTFYAYENHAVNAFAKLARKANRAR